MNGDRPEQKKRSEGTEWLPARIQSRKVACYQSLEQRTWPTAMVGAAIAKKTGSIY